MAPEEEKEKKNWQNEEIRQKRPTLMLQYRE